MPVTAAEVRAALIDVDYPASKDDLRASAGRNTPDDRVEEVDRALRAVPPVMYRNLDEVLASVTTDEEPGELTARLGAHRRQAHTHRGLSEREKEI